MEIEEIVRWNKLKHGDSYRIRKHHQSSYKEWRKRRIPRCGIRKRQVGMRLSNISSLSTLATLFICYSLISPADVTCQARTIRQRHPGANKNRNHPGTRHPNGNSLDSVRSIPTSMTQDHSMAPNERISTYFFQWIQKVWKIDTSKVELKDVAYPNYIAAMKDKVDVFYEEETRYYNSFHQIESGNHYYYNSNTESEPEGDMNQEHVMSEPEIPNELAGSIDVDDIDDDDKYLSVLDYPPISTRGLVASRDIEAGEIILQIPHGALWTVSNRIDNDPILSQVLGFEARMIHGWDAPSDEIPLLAVALLYNFELWRHADEEQHGESPYGAYLQLLDDTNVHDLIPHLWDSKTLRRSATVGVRKVAKAIQKDVKELYQRIMVPLIEEHPVIFGNFHDAYHEDYDEESGEYSSTDEGDDGLENYRDEEWLFSLERFHWAFALVNSRHWHLPIPNERQNEGMENENMEQDSGDQIDENGSPPASMPTDEWMELQQELEYRRDEEERRLAEEAEAKRIHENEWAEGNSFLAPLADLLNFGPPSTRGVYNSTTHTFDIVATFPISRGQEITFWYADACQDIFMANYGFTMPMMVPPCESSESIRYHNDDEILSTAQFAERLEEELLSTLDELDQMDVQMDHLVQALKSCDCSTGSHHHHNNDDSSSNSPNTPPKEDEPPQQRPTGRRPPKPTSRIYGSDRNQARHAIRGADRNAPVASIRQAGGDTTRRSESLNRSQKRKRQKDNHNMASIRDL